MNKSGRLDPQWIKQNRRDCRIVLAIFMGFFEICILLFVGLVYFAGAYVGYEATYLILLPPGMCLLFELVIVGDNLFLRYHGVEVKK